MKITLVQGHPDVAGGHYCQALAEAYLRGAAQAGHELRTIAVAQLALPLLANADEWQDGPPPPAVSEAQETIAWAEHLVIVFPLWLGDMPARLKGFFEQALRPGFAIGKAAPGRMWTKRLKGRSARVIVTMGMPAFFYRIYYRAHSVKSLKRNILEFCGISPVRASLVGTVEAAGHREKWLAKIESLGRKGL